MFWLALGMLDLLSFLRFVKAEAAVRGQKSLMLLSLLRFWALKMPDG